MIRYFAPFLVILFLVAAFLRVDFFFTIIYLFFAAYVLSRAWTRLTMRSLTAQRRYLSRAFPGDEVDVDITLQNRGWLPIPWVEVRESLPPGMISPPYRREVVSIGARATAHLRYTLRCEQRGYYELGPLTMEAGDLLGMIGASQAAVAPEPLIVYPRVVPLERLGLPTHAPHVQLLAPAALFEDPARVRGVRDYQTGDSQRRIHWTASASAGRLLVKQYQPAIARETLVCLDLDRDDYGQRQRYTATELAIVVAASLATHIINHEGLPTGLATRAVDPLLGDGVTPTSARFYLPPRSERAHLMSILEVLARVQVTEEPGFLTLLRQESVRLTFGATITVITGREHEGLLDTLAYLRRAGFAVALILVQPAQTPPDLRGRAQLLGIPVRRVWREQDVGQALVRPRK